MLAKSHPTLWMKSPRQVQSHRCWFYSRGVDAAQEAVEV